ncbi:hypothetical protein BpHYR1_052425 [Brachionus plicatilis]|uniref:Uncharacterized protein n=1 Tax=Brachionus plicatilis TaxID=10195 RepID=A0A3M7QWS6_BRAPC|nr:hypothetical protein BpHYR1_052425 [Brachionus plicatilis]
MREIFPKNLIYQLKMKKDASHAS